MSDVQSVGSVAPVVLLVFNRPELTRRVVESVRRAQPSKVYVVADGPRPDHPEDVKLCEEVRSVVTSADWDCPVHTRFAEANMGLKSRVSSGLDWVFDHEEHAIIIEDDCLADGSFFHFATELLERFADDDRLGIVSGNNFLRGREIDGNSYFFSPDMRIWGWATWSRVWKDFSSHGLDAVWTSNEARQSVQRLQSPSRRKALVRDADRAHLIDSWALPFVLHAQRRGYLSVVPRVNLVTNIGFGALSTHTKFESFTAEIPLSSIEFPLRHPEEIAAHPDAGRLEAQLERREWFSYPLRHPIDVIKRVWRYLRQR